MDPSDLVDENGAATVALVGGSVSAAALIDELAATLRVEQLRLRLVAQQFDRVEALVRHGRHLIASRPGWTIESSRTVPEAVDGATAVVLMLRVGGLDARRADEVLAQRFGFPGDEGLGPGGAANALRTLPVIDDLAADLARLAPHAAVLNLVAPLGLTTRVLLDHDLDAVGVCELPSVTERALRSVLVPGIELAYSGFNHLGWFWSPGRDPLDAAVDARLVDRGTLERFGAVPLKYHYWLHDPAAAERLGIARDPNRSETLIDLRDQARSEVAGRPDRRSDAVGARPTPWFTDALVPILDALLGGPPWDGYANVRNGDLVASFDPDVVVEVPARIGADGVHPATAQHLMPTAPLAFSRRVQRSEQLLHAAWRERDRSLVARSFTEGPHEVAPDLARALADAVSDDPGSPSVPNRKDPSVTTTLRFETSPTTTTDYVVGAGAWHDDHLAAVVRDRPLVAVVDEQVTRTHGPAVEQLLAGLDCIGRIEMRGGEQCKSQTQLAALLEAFETAELPKHGVVMSIGGGTISDVVGLAAMLMRRAVPLVLLPTTLLAQVDAAVGGKNGINSANTKNVIGHFHHPLVVACDPRLLETLDPRQLVSGIAECIKVFAVADDDALPRHAQTLLHPEWAGIDAWRDVVADAQHHKLRLLAEDPYEASSRRLLNYGHAFAHLLEERSDYQLLHGEAVLFGMLIENEVSQELGIATDAVDDLQQVIVDLVPPASRAHWIPFETIEPDLDKVRQMRRAAMNLVCLEAPGRAVIVDDASNEVLAASWRRAEDRLQMPLARTGALA